MVTDFTDSIENIYHVLNGDALKERFPDEIEGDKIIFRECLVDGPVDENALEAFFERRSQFVSESYPISASLDYSYMVKSEMNKLLGIRENSEINLWFEDDLFCQVNLWFTINLLKDKEIKLFLVRPDHHSPYSFADYHNQELINLFRQRQMIQKVDVWNKLWPAYQKENLNMLRAVSNELTEDYPFIADAVKAHVERLPGSDGKGRIEQVIEEIAEEFSTKDFGLLYLEFSRRIPIYGFGDLQVKRILDTMKYLS
ncbi:MAG: DUF1835 domain-containing protein [Bacteroidota bacterium]